MAYGITKYGIEIPSYEEILQSHINTLNTKLRDEGVLGANEKITSSSLVSDLFKVNALHNRELWETLEAVHNSGTWNGAEGIYLDDLLGRRGFFRLSPTKSSGMAVIKTFSEAPWESIITTSNVKFSGANNAEYVADSNTQIKDYIVAYKLDLGEDPNIFPTTTITGKKSSDRSAVTGSLDTTSAATIKSLFESIFDLDTDLIQYDGRHLYVGFTENDLENPVGVNYPTELYLSRNLGEKWSGIFVSATETGYNPLGLKELSNAVPRSFASGSNTVIIRDVTNFSVFSSGSGIESDTSYKARYEVSSDAQEAGTRNAMVEGLLGTKGVLKARIISNPSPDTDPNGVPPFSFWPIVVGGSSTDITNAIYNTKPILSQTWSESGDFVNVATLDGLTEKIYFQRATNCTCNITITYTTISNTAITSSIESQVEEIIKDYTDSVSIGGVVYRKRIEAAILSEVGLDIKDLSVSTAVIKTSDSSVAETKDSFNNSVIISEGFVDNINVTWNIQLG